MNVFIKPYRLDFINPAGTSRGIYNFRDSRFIILQSETDASVFGIGECAPLPNLSCDDIPNYEEILQRFCNTFRETGVIDYASMKNYPSMLFGLESALLHYNAGTCRLFDTPFSRGEEGIVINGLIWMGSKDAMFKQIEKKLSAGFTCLKLKIGAINFEDELQLLRYVREHFPASVMEIRVDANGAFAPHEALEKLKRLNEFEIHSIEQPIRAGQWDAMAKLCANTPIPIALDEELIGINNFETKKELLATIAPQYIILKPSLHGGIFGCNEWIKLAEEQSIPWWVTSALESNVGLNAIAQWTASLKVKLPQGLGTGLLYSNNFISPLYIEGERLWYNPQVSFDYSSIR